MVNGLVIVATRSTAGAVKLAGDGVGDVRQLLLLLLKVLGGGSGRVLLEPLSGLLNGIDKLIRRLVIDHDAFRTNKL